MLAKETGSCVAAAAAASDAQGVSQGRMHDADAAHQENVDRQSCALAFKASSASAAQSASSRQSSEPLSLRHFSGAQAHPARQTWEHTVGAAAPQTKGQTEWQSEYTRPPAHGGAEAARADTSAATHRSPNMAALGDGGSGADAEATPPGVCVP